MLRILQSEGNLLSLKLIHELDNNDYSKFTNALRDATRKGKLHLLIQFDDGIRREWHGPWNLLQLEWSIASQVERLAIVGDPTYANLMEIIRKPFTGAQVQTFESNQLADAQKWVQEGLQDYED